MSLILLPYTFITFSSSYFFLSVPLLSLIHPVFLSHTLPACLSLPIPVSLSEKWKMMTSPISSVAPPLSAVAPLLGNLQIRWSPVSCPSYTAPAGTLLATATIWRNKCSHWITWLDMCSDILEGRDGLGFCISMSTAASLFCSKWMMQSLFCEV